MPRDRLPRDTGCVKAAEREAALRRQRELAALAVRAQRRRNLVSVLCSLGGLVGYSTGLPLARMLVHHQPFDVATMGVAAGCYAGVTALIWGAFLGWERRRRRSFTVSRRPRYPALLGIAQPSDHRGCSGHVGGGSGNSGEVRYPGLGGEDLSKRSHGGYSEPGNFPVGHARSGLPHMLAAIQEQDVRGHLIPLQPLLDRP